MAHFWTGENPNLTFTSATQQSDKDCYIVFKAISSTSKNTELTSVEYSTDGLNWNPMTDLFPGEGDDVSNMVSSPAGVSYTFAWDANNVADLGPAFDGSVKARFTIKNHDGSGSEVAVESDWFVLDFVAPVCAVGWPSGETIGDSTPALQRSASDNSPPIETDWVIDDDPLFGNANGRQQTKAWSADSTFTPAALSVLGTWYFKIRCRDSYQNTSAWDTSGEFTLTLPIKPYALTDGVNTVGGFIVDDVIIGIINQLREYEADGSIVAGDANIVDWVTRKPIATILRLIDGPVAGVYERLEQCITWLRAKTLLDIEDIGGNSISVGGSNISYTPSDWVIISVRIINRPMRANLIYFEVSLEEV